MEFRQVASASFFQDKVCDFYMCDGSGFSEMGIPGHEYKVQCVCRKGVKVPVKFDESEVRFDIVPENY